MAETTETTGKTLLLTRPLAQSQAFLSDLSQALGAPPPAVISPLTETTPTGATIPAEGVLILTSGRAADAAGVALAGRLAYCVGDRTAEIARQAGATAISASGDAEALIARILADRPGPMVHLRGTYTATDIAARLAAQGIACKEVIVYRTDDLPLTGEARTLLSGTGPVLAPVFSPRSASLLAAAVGPTLARLTVAAIGPAAAAPLAAANPAVADRPDGGAMLALTLRLWAGLP